jgi:hypothetical protein
VETHITSINGTAILKKKWSYSYFLMVVLRLKEIRILVYVTTLSVSQAIGRGMVR